MPNRPRLKSILGTNVLRIRSARGLSQPGVSAAAKHAGLDVGQTTVGRVERAVHAADIETIEALGRGLGVEPWQLLIPGLDPAAPPSINEDALPADERQLLRDYRAASDSWKLTLRLMARLEPDDQPQFSHDVNILMAQIFGRDPVPNHVVEKAYGEAPHVAAIHQPDPPKYGTGNS